MRFLCGLTTLTVEIPLEVLARSQRLQHMAETRVNDNDNAIRCPDIDSEELSRIAKFLKHDQWIVRHPQEEKWMRAKELAMGYQLAVKHQVNYLKHHLIRLFERLDLFSPFGRD